MYGAYYLHFIVNLRILLLLVLGKCVDGAQSTGETKTAKQFAFFFCFSFHKLHFMGKFPFDRAAV